VQACVAGLIDAGFVARAGAHQKTMRASMARMPRKSRFRRPGLWAARQEDAAIGGSPGTCRRCRWPTRCPGVDRADTAQRGARVAGLLAPRSAQ